MGLASARERTFRLGTCCSLGLLAFASLPGISSGQIDPVPKSVEFSIVDTFTLQNIPAENLRAELFRKTQGNAVMADIIDLNLGLSAELGKPTLMAPVFGPKTQTIILRFPAGWWTTNMVRGSGSEGAFICRAKGKLVDPRPHPDDYAKYIDWCQARLVLATLDSGEPRPLPKP